MQVDRAHLTDRSTSTCTLCPAALCLSTPGTSATLSLAHSAKPHSDPHTPPLRAVGYEVRVPRMDFFSKWNSAKPEFTQTPGGWWWGLFRQEIEGGGRFFLNPDFENCRNLHAALRAPVRFWGDGMPTIALRNVVTMRTARGRDSRRCQHCGLPLAASKRLNVMPVGKPRGEDRAYPSARRIRRASMARIGSADTGCSKSTPWPPSCSLSSMRARARPVQSTGRPTGRSCPAVAASPTLNTGDRMVCPSASAQRWSRWAGAGSWCQGSGGLCAAFSAAATPKAEPARDHSIVRRASPWPHARRTRKRSDPRVTARWHISETTTPSQR